MTIKIGRAAVGQKFFVEEHLYTVEAYVPAGQPHDYRNGPQGLVFKAPAYTATSRYRDKEVRFVVQTYMSGAKKYLASQALPVEA